MNTQPTIFAQIMAFLPMHEFRKCVRRYRGDYKIKRFFCLDQFLCLAFAQLTYRESLRDIEACLLTMKSRLYHMGIRGRVSRCNLANANETRDWRIYADFAQVLITEARRIYHDEDIGLKLKETVFAFDSTTIDLCLSLFPWAKFRKCKGAIKLHTLYKLRWRVELFFRWIKQNLRIKSFYGTSENAVRTHIWVAMAIYALVAIIKKKMSMDLPLYYFLQILSVTAFEKVPLNQLLTFSDHHDSIADGNYSISCGR